MIKKLKQLTYKNSIDTNAKNKIGDFFATKNFKNLRRQPYPTPGSILIDGTKFEFHDAGCFYDTYQEIFMRGMYHFNTKHTAPVIIDGGANMGVSVVYFGKNFPTSKIIAFEPEQKIFEVLRNNIKQFGLNNVELHKKALWVSEEPLKFYTDGGMGGSATNVFSNQEPTIIETTVLKQYLQQPIALLKLDIEGAEMAVIKHCTEELKNVEHIFIEYHSYIDKEQELQQLLMILKTAGFRYHLSQSFSYQQPFVDKTLACENMDMAINIFGYRNK